MSKLFATICLQSPVCSLEGGQEVTPAHSNNVQAFATDPSVFHPTADWKRAGRDVTLCLHRGVRPSTISHVAHPRGCYGGVGQARLMLLAAKIQLGIDMEYLEARWDQILTLVPDLGGFPCFQFRVLRPLSIL